MSGGIPSASVTYPVLLCIQECMCAADSFSSVAKHGGAAAAQNALFWLANNCVYFSEGVVEVGLTGSLARAQQGERPITSIYIEI